MISDFLDEEEEGCETHLLLRSRGRYHRVWMDPLAVWVDPEPPLVAAGSRPAMVARVGPRRGAARQRRGHPSVGARVGERARGGAILLYVGRRPTSDVT
jgi:hypothetical protein